MRVSGTLIGLGFMGNMYLPLLSNIPAIQVVSLIVGLFGVVLKRLNSIASITVRYLLLTLLSFALLSFYPLITTNSSLGDDKILMFFYNFIFPLMSASFLISYFTVNEQMKILKNISIIFLCICLFRSFLGINEVLDNREFPSGYGNPIWYARAIGVAVIIVCSSVRTWNPIWLFSTATATFLLMQSPTRSVILGLVATLLISMLHRSRGKNTLLLLHLSLIVLLFIFGVFLNFDEVFMNRNIYSVLSRLDFYRFAVDGLLVSPFGHGVASFGLDYFGVDERNYPHNIFLEVGYEFGLFSLLAFFLFCLRSVFPSSGFYQRIFLFLLISACFSGDIAGNASVFVVGVIIIVMKKRVI